jgi:ParB-like chromosome segregation protein Spo0J
MKEEKMAKQLAIKYKKTEELIPYALNSRTHSEAQVAQIAASIREFGFTNPILLDGENGILAGHGRVMAARVLALDAVPTIEISNLSDGQKKAYVIADNKLALNAGWDDEILKLELQSLNDSHQMLTGFDASELNILFNGWQPEIDVKEKDGTNLDGITRTIKISISQDEETMALEAITNALDSAGVEYEFK